MPRKTISMITAAQWCTENYGVLLVSETYHDVTGRGVHNRHFPHKVEVWANRGGTDPHGHQTDAPYSVLLSAKSIAIVANPNMRDKTPYGESLVIGDEVDLAINGYVFGTYRVTAQLLSDPVLVPVADESCEHGFSRLGRCPVEG